MREVHIYIYDEFLLVSYYFFTGARIVSLLKFNFMGVDHFRRCIEIESSDRSMIRSLIRVCFATNPHAATRSVNGNIRVCKWYMIFLVTSTTRSVNWPS